MTRNRIYLSNLGVWIVRNSWGAIIATVATYDEALVKAYDV